MAGASAGGGGLARDFLFPAHPLCSNLERDNREINWDTLDQFHGNHNQTCSNLDPHHFNNFNYRKSGTIHRTASSFLNSTPSITRLLPHSPHPTSSTATGFVTTITARPVPLKPLTSSSSHLASLPPKAPPPSTHPTPDTRNLANCNTNGNSPHSIHSTLHPILHPILHSSQASQSESRITTSFSARPRVPRRGNLRTSLAGKTLAESIWEMQDNVLGTEESLRHAQEEHVAATNAACTARTGVDTKKQLPPDAARVAQETEIKTLDRIAGLSELETKIAVFSAGLICVSSVMELAGVSFDYLSFRRQERELNAEYMMGSAKEEF